MNTTAPSPAGPDQAAKPRLRFKLPTFRVGFAKQMDALRAYAILSDNGTKAVHYSRIAEVIKVHEANVSSMNPFFLEIGLIAKAANGYVPTPAVLDYNRAHAWNADTAAVRLAPLLRNTWFGQELSQRLLFRSIGEEEAIQILADASTAGPEAKPQLRILIDFCESAKIIERANGALKLLPVSAQAHEGESASWPFQTQETELPPSPLPPPPPPLPTFTPPPSASPMSAPQNAGGIGLDVSINVSMAEMKDWSPERITAFFTGIAQVLAAKNQSG
ncbi:hypothetical protein [Bradyrhizobium acaciae]|uniref:hypothetical protein n=1 Tax=Bradyrhizobium acaciae TaxID=2683706 RepID=UPI001E2EF2EE|nr:hypothetical protein [Bradyrhizobium acaciae]MCC8983085.1 hypothetical protein [Bradyrhizobium acaciae]